jgi:hypothetical protein
MPSLASACSRFSPTSETHRGAAVAGARAEMERRVERDRARAERLLAIAHDLGGDVHARFVTLIPESVWGGRARDFFLHELGASPYADWNLAFVTTAPEALEAGALPDWPDMARRTEPLAAQALERIEAHFRAVGDLDAAIAALAALARDIRGLWERHSTRGC